MRIIGTKNSPELTLWSQCITKEEFLRLDSVKENLISGNYFCFSVAKKMKMVSIVIFGITITIGDWAANIISIEEIDTALK